jgi:hypothetical protein
MLAQSIADLQKEEPGLLGLGMAIPSVFGTGVQTYTDPIPMEGKTATGRPNVTWRQQPSLGEDIFNKITGTQISTIPKDQWVPLAEARKNEQLWKIKLDSIKKIVLTTGESQTVSNPITGAQISVYLDNGVVKTKDLTPKTTKPKATKTTRPKAIKVSSPKKMTISRVKAKKVANIKLAKIPKAPKMKAIKIKSPNLSKAKGLKIKKPKNVVYKIKV